MKGNGRMTKIQRLKTLIIGFITLVFGVLLFEYPDRGLEAISMVTSISLTVMGINKLIFYFRMARHMVGGINSLIIGLILTDLGIYAITLKNLPPSYITIYLLAIHGFTGVIDIKGATDAIINGGGSWRIRFFTGIINLAMAVTAFIYGMVYHDLRTVVFIYATGICYTGIMRMLDAFRRTAVAYIQ